MRSILRTILMVAAASGLAACSDDDDDDQARTGSASVAVTDAAVDGAERVVVEFTGVELKPADGESIRFDLDSPRQLDLLALQGMEFEPLIQDEVVPAGEYNWIRLHMNDNACAAMLEPGVEDPAGSFIELEDGTLDALHVPSGNQTGLKLNSQFVIAAGGNTNLTIDFDVRKSVVNPTGRDCHHLKPSLRLVDNLEIGHISGTVVNTELLNNEGCLADDPVTPAAVYLFEEDNVVDDIDGTDDPLTSALVNLNEESGEYEFEIGFVPADNYTLALTCDADIDDVEAEDEIEFLDQQPVTVNVDQTANADF